MLHSETSLILIFRDQDQHFLKISANEDLIQTIADCWAKSDDDGGVKLKLKVRLVWSMHGFPAPYQPRRLAQSEHGGGMCTFHKERKEMFEVPSSFPNRLRIVVVS